MKATDLLTVRLDADTKAELEKAAASERRPLASMARLVLQDFAKWRRDQQAHANQGAAA